MNTLTDFEWQRDLSTICGDPRYMAESVANFTKMVGLEQSATLLLPFYFVPVVMIGGLFAAIFFVRRRIVVVEWPDILLLSLPAVVWYELVLMYPIGKLLVSFWELTILGVLAGVSVILRRSFTGRINVEASKVGVLGTTSMAVLFWAFMPSW
jgi:hypothetical protein